MKKIKAWIIPPLKDKVSHDGWNFFTPVFLTRAEALYYGSKELIKRCTITY